MTKIPCFHDKSTGLTFYIMSKRHYQMDSPFFVFFLFTLIVFAHKRPGWVGECGCAREFQLNAFFSSRFYRNVEAANCNDMK